jgi:hypothetical protein
MLCYKQCPCRTSFGPVGQGEEVTCKTWQAGVEVGIMQQLEGYA